MSVDWHELSEIEVLQRLGSDLSHGLEEREAIRRLGKYGYNELSFKSGRSPFRIFWQQFTSTMVVILIIAAVVSFFLAD